MDDTPIDVAFDSTITIKHVGTGGYLHSHQIPYPRSEDDDIHHQVSLLLHDGDDDDNFWVVRRVELEDAKNYKFLKDSEVPEISQESQDLQESQNIQEPKDHQELLEPRSLEEPQDLQEPQNLQESQNIQESQGLQELQEGLEEPQDLQEPRDLQDSQDIQEPQDLQELQGFEEPQDLQELQEPQGFEEPQDLQELQEPQGFEEPQDSQESQESQDHEEPQNLQEPQEPQYIQEPQEPQYIQEPQEPQYIQELPGFQEPQEPQEFQGHQEYQILQDLPNNNVLDWIYDGALIHLEHSKTDTTDLWRVEIAKHNKSDPESSKRLRSIHTKFRLYNYDTGCYLFSHFIKLPSGGPNEVEVTCITDGNYQNSLWYIETNSHPDCISWDYDCDLYDKSYIEKTEDVIEIDMENSPGTYYTKSPEYLTQVVEATYTTKGMEWW
ncbi:13510_t:CDS:2 [Racocetra fulgida]|uniref:13510_t:CDS:1 n=1 Tax=Racocetra fulgida TaxID=60492 RepID=A0A9N9A696_9GLOM|nr:13510_t:CDS:2 [Racocetra fulgida]